MLENLLSAIWAQDAGDSINLSVASDNFSTWVHETSVSDKVICPKMVHSVQEIIISSATSAEAR